MLVAPLGLGTTQAAQQPDAAEEAIVLLVVQRRGEPRLTLAAQSGYVKTQRDFVTTRFGGIGILGCADSMSTVHYTTTPTHALRASVERARQDYCRRNAGRSVFPPSTVNAVRSAVLPPALNEPDRCRRNPTIHVTRVGFDSLRTVAVVGYYVSVGAGPYPGCGYINTGGFVFQRGRNGRWRPIGALPGMFT
jgi:hypothetical protein